MTRHRHRATGEATYSGYQGPVSRDENPAAHGGVTRWEHCRCGATRPTNVNGPHEERGRWEAPDSYQPTHRIVHPGGVVAVMLVDGAAYTRAEWEAGAPADWELVEGRWLFQGEPRHCWVQRFTTL